jgi:transaldolase/glucose-6-phosphate isomerase
VLVLAPLPGGEWMRLSLGDYRQDVQAAVAELSEGKVIARLWVQDHHVWSPSPVNISNRLGWLRLPQQMQPELPAMCTFLDELRQAGFQKALLLGMGGSSLAPDLFSKVFPANPGSLELMVLDSTDPGAVLGMHAQLDPHKTLYIVSTKSGGTEETLSFLKHFYQHASQALGSPAGDHFIAITDPGSKLVDLGGKLHFRKIFLNDPNIGGRYSALSHFGLLPATLAGVDCELLLSRARDISSLCSTSSLLQQNPGALLGAALGKLATLGRDKLTFVNSPALNSFADWTEQLIAESTGKAGRGILPVVGEELAEPQLYGKDRIFVHLYLDEGEEPGELPVDAKLSVLETAGHPVIHIPLLDLYDIGAQFLLWEIATAIAGHVLQINPFDQPNVEAAKVRARQMVAAYKTSGALPLQTPLLETEQFSLYGSIVAQSLREALSHFLANTQPGDYIAVQAYLKPEPSTTAALHRLQSTLREKTHLATTIGYGPRFLHSTGQLHKGDRGNGCFILLTDTPAQDLHIPDEVGSPDASMTFGILKLAQALGDQMALADAGRRLIRIHLHQDTQAAIALLEQELRLI